MIELKTPGEIEAMREAGRVVAATLAAVRAAARPGASLLELNEVAATVIAEAGAKPAFLGYHPDWAPSPFPGVICTSVNDAIVHGVPGRLVLGDGDLVSIDSAVVLDGWCGDAAVSFAVGSARPEDLALISATERALAAGIAQAVPGNRLGDIAHAIGVVARAEGYGIMEGYGGHGIGRTMHESPHVANEGRAGRGMVLRPGLVLAVEPMFTAGGLDSYRTDVDGWTLRTVDGERAAHSEHTVAVTSGGGVVLTVL
ncbi:type I methionyl aminopeptidase [Allokutzneria sp. NRRL B-24872]|uniref:type I methionyl aminopeptidase n=1 Tax=Allokutzneria sp. NRRL B-24872 TaxID=1137961 RepID=UPI000A36D6DF|nr:type I methionyl aminopeptidase [Allokutzneria sp. NRRL B-24872]